MKPHPEIDTETVAEIVSITTGKCFDWAQGAIAETMAAVAAQLTQNAVSLKHELENDDS